MRLPCHCHGRWEEQVGAVVAVCRSRGSGGVVWCGVVGLRARNYCPSTSRPVVGITGITHTIKRLDYPELRSDMGEKGHTYLWYP